MIKVRMVENPRLPPMLKVATPIKSTFSPDWLGIFGCNCVSSINGTLLLRIIKMKKSFVAELGHSDLLPVYEYNFAEMQYPRY